MAPALRMTERSIRRRGRASTASRWTSTCARRGATHTSAILSRLLLFGRQPGARLLETPDTGGSSQARCGPAHPPRENLSRLSSLGKLKGYAGRRKWRGRRVPVLDSWKSVASTPVSVIVVPCISTVSFGMWIPEATASCSAALRIAGFHEKRSDLGPVHSNDATRGAVLCCGATSLDRKSVV